MPPSREPNAGTTQTISRDAEAEARKKQQLLEKLKASNLSKQLQVRLQYARLKVDHGWQKQTLNEVENLYFHHMQMNPHARPAPPAPPASDPSTTQVTVTHHAPTRNMPISFRPKWGMKGSGSNNDSAEPNAEADVNTSVEIDPSLAFPPESTVSVVPSPQHTTSSSAPHPSAALSPTTDSDNPFLPTSSVLTRSSLSETHPTTTNSPFTTPSKVSPATDRRSRRAVVNIPHDSDSTGRTFQVSTASTGGTTSDPGVFTPTSPRKKATLPKPPRLHLAPHPESQSHAHMAALLSTPPRPKPLAQERSPVSTPPTGYRHPAPTYDSFWSMHSSGGRRPGGTSVGVSPGGAPGDTESLNGESEMGLGQ